MIMRDPDRTIPATINGHTVVAWLPSLRYDNEAVAVVYRAEPDFSDAPFVVWAVRPTSSANGWWRTFNGIADIADLGEAMAEATAIAMPADTDPARPAH